MTLTKSIAASYDFEEDAMGLGDFITKFFDNVKDDDSPVIYVEDEEGRPAKQAKFIKRELTDGSHVYELVISFED